VTRSTSGADYIAVMHDEHLGSVSTLEQPLPDAVVRYAAHDDGLVDVHLPVGESAALPPLVVLLHGGFWRQAHDRKHTRGTASALAGEGFVVATPEYRRSGGAGGWPTTLRDVDTALGALPGLLAGLGVLVDDVTVVGHSAGGHLALWLANQPHRLRRVVGLAPVADLRAAAAAGLGEGATQRFLGGGPEDVPERYDDADPATRLHDRPSCDVVLVHGDRDDVVPVSVSEGLAAAHPFVRLERVAGADHFAVMDPRSSAWPAVLEAVRGVAG
jgi:acetyl esterase/lipase